MIEVRPLRADDASACDAVVRSLPYHFALESGREQCSIAVRSERGLVACDGDEILGFLTFMDRFDVAAEITWMAVRGDRRRQGIGTRLLERVAADLRAEGRTLLAVLTVSPSDPGKEPPDGYQSTRAFYRKMGFVLVRDLPGMWESDTPVLMVRTML
jgi:ribosomal protein S18 acetylase RimI-like enzyme